VNQASADGRVFDLSDISEKLYIGWLRSKWRTTVIMIGILAVASSAMISLAAFDALVRRLPGRATADVALVAFFVAIASLLFIVGNARSRRPATAVKLGTQALVISYFNGKNVVLRWNDAAFQIRIAKMRSATLGTEVAYSLFWRYPRLFMPEEVAAAIEATARERGLSVERAKDADSPSGECILIRSQKRLGTK
jgi:hypothetical protein